MLFFTFQAPYKAAADVWLTCIHFWQDKTPFPHPQTHQSALAFDLLVAASLVVCPYHPNAIGGWSLHSTFTVQMLSFQWHFKQALSIYSHSGFMSFDKMPLANRVITICGSKVNFFFSSPDFNYHSTVAEMKLWMLDGENKHSSCGEDKVGWVQQGIDFLLRKSGARANCSVSLTGPYRPIIYKTEGYHNCLLNNSIKQWRRNLCLGSKLSSALDAEIEKISAATPSIYFFTGEITNTNTAVIAGHMRLIPCKDIIWD